MNIPRRIRNLGIAGIMALTGCQSLIIVMIALFIGLWLDSIIGQRGPATICLLAASVPLSLFIMIRTAMWLVQRIELPAPQRNQELVSPDEKEE